ncbi:type IV pilus biogenesis protein PilZ [Arenicella chitinivorans]|uniref:Type IV pilus biogenesis protein PilZ n=1 Tax=Arenicella chitinivorans TaxID=1329800 RepID=A0A918RZI1_9GAMM|nr:PilZ domain-containing protein [Arenicella chitinivorans]GHA16758.1 type IV pilus biogenesis protein PilZ [Arenicella chitinivorans]
MTVEKQNIPADKARNAVISIAIKDKQALYMSYMPFVKNGGLFVPTKKDYNLGDEMFLLVKIMDEIDPVHISGKVIWVSPPGALGNRPRGVGVQFMGDDARATVNLIEQKLGASISLTRSTHTM